MSFNTIISCLHHANIMLKDSQYNNNNNILQMSNDGAQTPAGHSYRLVRGNPFECV